MLLELISSMAISVSMKINTQSTLSISKSIVRNMFINPTHKTMLNINSYHYNVFLNVQCNPLF